MLYTAQPPVDDIIFDVVLSFNCCLYVVVTFAMIRTNYGMETFSNVCCVAFIIRALSALIW